ncbi:MAG: HD domain-containing protein [Firmicutes bacterium]|nr:HD domain-containing protein [Bacillota bacterium]
MIGTALEIAWKAHEGQKDKGGKPYIRHPLSVAAQMDTEEEITTALLHDVVEDSDYTFEDLEAAGFPERVMEALRLLTHDDDTDYFEYVRKLRENDLARKVKLADLAHNSREDRLGRNPTEEDWKRLEKYAAARKILEEES